MLTISNIDYNIKLGHNKSDNKSATEEKCIYVTNSTPKRIHNNKYKEIQILNQVCYVVLKNIHVEQQWDYKIQNINNIKIK